MALDLEQIQDSPHLLDILLQMEDVLDSLDIYVYRNWFKGEVVNGPVVRRYWLSFTLQYPHKDMPDPRGAIRLLQHGVRVRYEKAKEESDDPRVDAAAGDSDETRRKDADAVWLVHVSMPRRLVSQIATSEMDYYDDEIDEDDVESARDSGINDETAYDKPDSEQAGQGEKGDEEEEEDEENK